MGIQSKSWRGVFSAAVATIAAAISAKPAIAAYAYALTNLGTPSGQSLTEGTSINSNGNVIINTDAIGSGTHAEYYNGGYQSLGSLANNGDDLSSLNSSGLVVGTSNTAAPSSHQQAVYENTSSPSNPTALSGGSSSAAYAVNNSGIIVGSSFSGAAMKAVTWSSTSATPSTIVLPSSDWDNTSPSAAQGINTGGSIVGQATAIGGNTDAFLDISGTITDISPPSGVDSVAEAINNGGTVVGNSVDGSGNALAFLYTSAGGTVLLPTLGGPFDESNAESINLSGQAVGQADAADDATDDGSDLHAVIYNSATSVVDLNSQFDPTMSPGWILTNAESINDTGDIVGFGYLNGTQEAFLLTPQAAVPEPASLTITLGAGVLLMRRRRV